MRPPLSVFPSERVVVLVEDAGKAGVRISVRKDRTAEALSLRRMGREATPTEAPVGPPTAKQAKKVAKLLGSRAVRPVALWVDDSLIEYDWESHLLHLGLAGPVVRLGLAAARVDQLPLHAPVYWCHVGPFTGEVNRDMRALGRFAAVRTALVDDVNSAAQLGWPRFDLITWSVTPAVGDFLSRPSFGRNAEDPYSVSWLERILHRYQVRTLVLFPSGDEARGRSLALAHDLVSRGGPAVGVSPTDAPATLSNRSVAGDLLAGASIEEIATLAPHWAWWAGPGRERPLQQPRLTLDQLERITDVINRRLPKVERVRDAGSALGRILAVPSTLEIRGAMSTRIDMAWRDMPRTSRLWEGLGFRRLPAPPSLRDLPFDVSGTLTDPVVWPVAETLAACRPFQGRPVSLTDAVLGESAAKTGLERFVNLRLQRQEGPSDAPLPLGDVCMLHVDIGPPGAATPLGADPLDEIVLWQPDEQGLWLDLAVTGLDFEVLGAPIQQAWLPRRGITGSIAFRVIPVRAGVSAVRVQVYGRGRLLQSYRLAAIIVSGEPSDSTEWAAQLAEALAPAGLDEDVARIEQDGGASSLGAWQRSIRELDLLDDWDRPVNPQAARRVSITVNQHRDESIVTARIGERYEVNRGLPTTHGETIRAGLDVLMGKKQAESLGFTEASAHANARRLGRPLVDLALAGNALFIGAFAKEVGDALTKLPDETIMEVDHLLAAKAIPWNVVYDRELDTSAGEPALCPVGFRAASDGKPCGHLEGCMATGPEGKPEVLCPRGFWGLRRRVELPLGPPASPAEPSEPARASTAAVLIDADVVGTASLDTILDVARKAVGEDGVLAPVPPKKPQLSQALKDPNLAVAYVSCHAFSSIRGRGERLSFDGLNARADDPAFGLMTNLLVNDLQSILWRYGPLVILNACGTATYRGGSIPTLLSTLVTRCRAGGVVATEVSVLNPLAAAFGATLMGAYLDDGLPVGDAVLHARRELARHNNPLGLAWTVYSDSEHARFPKP